MSDDRGKQDASVQAGGRYDLWLQNYGKVQVQILAATIKLPLFWLMCKSSSDPRPSFLDELVIPAGTPSFFPL